MFSHRFCTNPARVILKTSWGSNPQSPWPRGVAAAYVTKTGEKLTLEYRSIWPTPLQNMVIVSVVCVFAVVLYSLQQTSVLSELLIATLVVRRTLQSRPYITVFTNRWIEFIQGPVGRQFDNTIARNDSCRLRSLSTRRNWPCGILLYTRQRAIR